MTEKSLFDNSEEFKILNNNLMRIKENISVSMNKSGRHDAVRIMAVTKTVPYEKINFAISAGIDLLGENRVQEFLSKRDFYDKEAEVHFIGKLQINKVKYIIDKVDMIHSADSIKLVDEINKRALFAGGIMNILIEVNIGGEESKSGINPCDVFTFAEYCIKQTGIRLRGLMTVPPIGNGEDNRRYFEKMQKIFWDCKERYGDSIDTLSMGMSGDYEQAVLCGANIVRIGSALFGKRNYRI